MAAAAGPSRAKRNAVRLIFALQYDTHEHFAKQEYQITGKKQD